MNKKPPSSPDVDMTRGVYRRIYAGFRTGKRINKLTLSAEAWFWRVHTVADDYGNLTADPIDVFTETVGKRVGEVTVENVGGWTSEMLKVGLLKNYESGGDGFYHIVGFELLQPASRNGRRIRRVPASPWDIEGNGLDIAENGAGAELNTPSRCGKRNEGRSANEVSGGIQVHPGESGRSHSHSEPHTNSEEEEEGTGIENGMSTRCDIRNQGRQTPSASAPPAVEFRCAGGEVWIPDDPLKAELSTAFPDVDIGWQILQASQKFKLLSVKKSAGEMRKWIWNWMKNLRDDERGPPGKKKTKVDVKTAEILAGIRGE